MMGSWREKIIWVYRKPIDFRKQLNGLIQTIVDETKAGFDRQGLYIFRNQQRDKLKLLVWDRNGFFMGYKRLERGKFDFPEEGESGEIRFSWEEFEQLISGMPMVRLDGLERGRILMS